MYKKIFVVIVVFMLLIQSLLSPVLIFGQNPWYTPSQDEFNLKVNNAPESEIFGERYTQAQVYWIIYSLMNFVSDPNVQKCAADAKAASTDITQQLISFRDCGGLTQANSGLFGLAKLTGDLTHRPLSSLGYLSYLAGKFGVPVAQAQQFGFGFSTALQPVFGIWVAARNAAYALMILATIFLAFMVMFRTKISPQVSIGIQFAIQRIIIGLLLITFSYAIAGFVVDLSYVVQGIISPILASSGLINMGYDSGVGRNWNTIDIFNQMNDVWAGIRGYGLITLAWVLIVAAALGLGTFVLTGGGGWVVVGIIAVITIIALLIAIFRIFWTMLKSYVMIIFCIIALPLAALGYVAIPNDNVFIKTLRVLAGYVSVFVTITISVMTAHLLFWNMSGGDIWANLGGRGAVGSLTAGLFNPYRSRTDFAFPTSGGGMPGFGQTDMSSIGLFIGLVVLLMTPSIANNIRSLIATGRPTREGLSMAGAGFVGGIAGAAVAGVQKTFGETAGKTLKVWGGHAAGRIQFVKQSIKGGLRRTGSQRVGSDRDEFV